MNTTPHDKALAAACEATILGEDENYKPVHLELREAETAISAYLSSIGGVMCQRNPSAWAHRLNLELDQFLTEFTGEPEHPFGEPGVEFSAEFTVNSTPLHAPLPIAGKGDGWMPIEMAPKEEVFLAFEPHGQGGFMFAACIGTDGEVRETMMGSAMKPTHFRPLPAPPSLQSDSEGGNND